VTPADLKARRTRRALSQTELARRVGVSRTTLWRWEQGRAAPSPEQSRRLRQSLRAAPSPPQRPNGLPIAQLRSGAATLFETPKAAIVHGDALGLLPKLPEACCDLIFADPPYNIGKRFAAFHDRWPNDAAYLTWCERWLSQCLRVLSPTGSLYLMASTQAMPQLDLWLRERIAVLSRIIWHYDSSGVQARRRFGSMHEPILHCVADASHYTFNSEAIAVEARTGARRKLIDHRKPVPAPYSSTKVPGNVWYFPRVRYRMAEYEAHPSQKPEALLERIVAASSNRGDLVLDPFAGTFTSGAVATRLGRRFLGFESQDEYVAIGRRRLGLSGPTRAT